MQNWESPSKMDQNMAKELNIAQKLTKPKVDQKWIKNGLKMH